MQALKDYLTDAKIKQNVFAERIGISQEYLSRIIHGKDTPGPILRKLIAHETGIKEDDWA